MTTRTMALHAMARYTWESKVSRALQPSALDVLTTLLDEDFSDTQAEAQLVSACISDLKSQQIDDLEQALTAFEAQQYDEAEACFRSAESTTRQITQLYQRALNLAAAPVPTTTQEP